MLLKLLTVLFFAAASLATQQQQHHYQEVAKRTGVTETPTTVPTSKATIDPTTINYAKVSQQL
jgi:hypothetical protein